MNLSPSFQNSGCWRLPPDRGGQGAVSPAPFWSVLRLYDSHPTHTAGPLRFGELVNSAPVWRKDRGPRVGARRRQEQVCYGPLMEKDALATPRSGPAAARGPLRPGSRKALYTGDRQSSQEP